MFISGITNADHLPVLERMMQFAGRRQTLLNDAIANFDTPGYRAKDVSIAGFQSALAEAVDARRERYGARSGELPVRDTREVAFGRNGIDLRPTEVGANLLFHDGNDRDLEQTMKELAENALTFRTVAQMTRTHMDQLLSAIRERP